MKPRGPGIAVARHPAGGRHGAGDAAPAASSLQDAVAVPAPLRALPRRAGRRPGRRRLAGGRRRRQGVETDRRGVRLPGVRLPVRLLHGARHAARLHRPEDRPQVRLSSVHTTAAAAPVSEVGAVARSPTNMAAVKIAAVDFSKMTSK